MNLPQASQLVWSAFRAGGLVGVRYRLSRRTTSGVALDACFKSQVSASAWAVRWAARLGLSVKVRRGSRPGYWSVSVPVSGCVPFMGEPIWVTHGGVRRIAAVALAADIAAL